ncbi:MAG: chemotaxis protein CheW [Chthoniobacteraceae bacterium]
MLYLLFEIGADRYALPAPRIVSVEPAVQLKRIPLAAQGIAGVFNYHGQAVPVVDLCAMALGRPAHEDYLSTRLLVVSDPDSPERLLGLLAERATETAHFHRRDFQEPGVRSDDAPYLGPVVSDRRGLIQLIETTRLLTPEIRAVLWKEAAEAL